MTGRMCSFVRRGLTLLELLMVVMLIAILTALAIPAILEAQTRAKIASVHENMAVMATAIEIYRIDNATYPPTFELTRLTTPVSYLTQVPEDAFETADLRQPIQMGNPGKRYFLFGGVEVTRYLAADYYSYNPPYFPDRSGESLRAPVSWMLKSVGPNDVDDWTMRYDPTNGVISRGDLARFGPG
ncbi:prepilin-type N-terminal cleavage/methylation domain-containing protein [bacterium]|nr:prepilin-type N-terminal cleavage/methylation domain-containing protein [bacterium]